MAAKPPGGVLSTCTPYSSAAIHLGALPLQPHPARYAGHPPLKGEGPTGDALMTVTIYIPCDSVALALGANRVAVAVEREISQRGMDARIVRNGSRGMFWLETMVEVETAHGRFAWGPVKAKDVPGLFDAGLGLVEHSKHPLFLGDPTEIPFFKNQQRLTFARVGTIDPLSLDDYRKHDGLRGLTKAVGMAQADIVKEVTESGLRGRGGAGFPTGIKWKTVLDTGANELEGGVQKYIVCNADEGDSGTFADRMIMEGDPFVLIEGMAIAGVAVGATKGYIYIRSEYPEAVATMQQAVRIARRENVLGRNILGSDFTFDMEVRVGAGAYVCGEETSLLESLEGKRGQVRAKPPLPAHKGLFGKPTVINNVISLASVPIIMDRGGAYYKDFGMGRSRGTMALQIAGNVKYGGLYEAAFGLTLGEIIDEIGGGTLTGRPVKAVQVGGPLGAYFPRELFDTPFDYEAFAAKDGLIGHAGIVVFDDTADMLKQARFAMEFCAIESCSKCTPCRIGSTRGVETLDRLAAGIEPEKQIELVTDLCNTMKFGSLCALGGFTPYPVMSALTHFPDDFRPAAMPVAAE